MNVHYMISCSQSILRGSAVFRVAGCCVTVSGHDGMSDPPDQLKHMSGNDRSVYLDDNHMTLRSRQRAENAVYEGKLQ